MNQNAYNIIMDALTPVFKENEFKPAKGGDVWQDGKKAFRVTFSEENKLFAFESAELDGAEEAEFSEISSWLFDDSHTEKDAKAIGEDFADSLKEKLGVKKQHTRSAEVALPSKRASGDDPDISSFTAQFLALFPQFKDEYKNSVAKYGEFLYDDFYTQTAVPLLRTLLGEKNKKQLVKLFEFLNTMYAGGDADVCSLVTYTIIGKAIRDDVRLWTEAAYYMEDAKYLKAAGGSMVRYLQGHKKLLAEM
jgi:hypothetical protein